MANTKVQSEQIADDAVVTSHIADNVGLGGSPTTTTQSPSDNSTKIATTAYVDAAYAALVDSSPATLNTLNELAAALGDDANFSTTVTNSIATKLPLAGGTITGATTLTTATAAAEMLNIVSTHASGIPILTLKGAHSAQVRYQDENGNNQARIDFNDGGQFKFIDATDGSAKLEIDANGLDFHSNNLASVGTISSGAITSTGGSNVFEQAKFGSSSSDNSQVTIGYFDANATNGLPALLNGSDFGGLIQGGENGKLVLGIRDNDASDSLDIVSGSGNFMSDSTYDKVVATFKADGNVGIGTDNPSAILDVTGDSNSDDNMLELINSKYGSTDISGETGILFGWSNHVAAKIAAFKEGTVNRTGFKIIGEAGFNVPTTIATFRSTGNVGIGITDPDHKLEIGGAHSQLKLTDTDDDNYVQMSYSSDYLAFRMNSTTATPVLALNDNGNVGIGTTSPSQKLEILDTSNAKTRFAYSSAIYGEIGRKSDGNYEFSAYENGANIIFGTSTTNGATTERMKINASGSVGVMNDQTGLSSGTYDMTWGGGSKAHGSHISPYMTLSTRYGTWDANIGCNARSNIGQTSGGTEQATSYGGGGASNLYVGFTTLNWYHWSSSVTNTLGTNLPISSAYQMMVADSGGNLNINGTYYNNASDRRLKDNITPISSALDKVKKLTGNTFTWKTDDSLPIPEQYAGKTDVGVIAQEVQEVVPEAVGLSPWDIEYKEIDNPDYVADAEPPIPQKIQSKDVSSESGNDYLTVNEEKLVPLLIEAIKEQQEQIETLKKEVEELKGG